MLAMQNFDCSGVLDKHKDQVTQVRTAWLGPKPGGVVQPLCGSSQANQVALWLNFVVLLRGGISFKTPLQSLQL